jgi:competence protein ComEA
MKGKFYSIYFLVAALLLAVSSNSFAADRSDTKKSDRSTTVSSKQKININTADAATLQTLPGVGASIAEAIIAARPYKNVAELKEVRGIGDSRYAEIRPMVTVGARESNVGAAGSSTRGADKASQRPQREIDREAPPSVSTPPAENRSTRGSDKASQRPQRSIDQEAEPSASVPPLTPSSTRGADKASQRPQRPVDREPSTSSTSSTRSANAKVNINTASQAELESLLGIGPVKAQAIIDNRPYKTKDEIKRVPGIKDGTYEKIEDQITIR